jgi:hypothetical protein
VIRKHEPESSFTTSQQANEQHQLGPVPTAQKKLLLRVTKGG